MSDTAFRLSAKIEDRKAKIGVIGLGYVGLPLCRAFAKGGFPVLGFDVDPKKIELLRAGRGYSKHIPDADIAAMRDAGFEATLLDFDRLREADVIIVCVPTPLTEAREPDLSFIVKSTASIAACLRPGQLVVLESTTYPGTTRDVVLPMLTATGLKPRVDFFLAFSPEREDPGNAHFGTTTIPKVVGGLDVPSRRLAAAVYGSVIEKVVEVSSPEVAARRAEILGRKHLSSGQHRPRQRAQGPLRPDGNRRLGSDRRGEDEAVRFPGVLPRPRPRRTLHPDRSVLSDMGRPQVRPVDPLHRAGRRGQPRDAGLGRRQDRQACSTTGPSRSGRRSKITLLGMGVQEEEGHRRQSRVAGLRDPGAAAAQRGRRSVTTTRTSLGCRRSAIIRIAISSARS